MYRTGKRAEAEPSGKSHGPPQRHFRHDWLIGGSIEHPWQKARRHVSSPLHAELIQYRLDAWLRV
jgi:hypothetical protein